MALEAEEEKEVAAIEAILEAASGADGLLLLVDQRGWKEARKGRD